MIIASTNNDKLVKTVVDGQNTLYFDVCCYLRVDAVTRDIDSNKSTINIFAADGFDTWTFKGDLSAFEPKNLFKFLSDNGVAVRPKYVDDLAEYLIDEINVKINAGSTSYVHSKVGWNKAFGKMAFFGKGSYNAYSNNHLLNSEYQGCKFEEIGEYGNLKTYEDMIAKHVLTNDNLKLAYALGFTSPITALLSDDCTVNSIIINFSGESSKGKSTTLGLMASIWGSGNIGKGNIIKTFNATTGGILKCLEDNYGFPVYFDDTQTKERDDHSAENWRQFIYALTTGSSRLTVPSQFTPTAKWRTTLVLCSENSLFDQTTSDSGLKGRLLDFSEVNWTSSAESAEEITSVVKNNYGFYGPKFVTGLASKGIDAIKTLYNDYLKELRESLKGKVNTVTRTTQAGAILLATVKLVKEILNLHLGEEFIKSYLIDLYSKNEIKEDSTRSAYEEVIQFVNANERHFLMPNNPDRNTPMAGEIYGKYCINDEDGQRVIAIISTIVDKYVFNKYPDKMRIKRKLRELGLIYCDKNKLNKKVPISNYSIQNPRCFVIRETAKYPDDDEIPMVETSEQALLKAKYGNKKAKKQDSTLIKEPSQIINLSITTKDGFNKRVPLKYSSSLKNFSYSLEGIDLKAGYELEFEECDENNTVLNTRADVDSSGYSKIHVDKDGTYFIHYCPNPQDGVFFKIDVLAEADLKFNDDKAIDEIFAEHNDDNVIDMEESKDEN